MNREEVYKVLEEEGLLCERLIMQRDIKDKSVKNDKDKTIRGKRKRKIGTRKRG